MESKGERENEERVKGEKVKGECTARESESKWRGRAKGEKENGE